MKKGERYKKKKIAIEAAVQGWIVKELGKPAEVFVRWESVVKKLEHELTSKGDRPMGEE